MQTSETNLRIRNPPSTPNTSDLIVKRTCSEWSNRKLRNRFVGAALYRIQFSLILTAFEQIEGLTFPKNPLMILATPKGGDTDPGTTKIARLAP